MSEKSDIYDHKTSANIQLRLVVKSGSSNRSIESSPLEQIIIIF